MLSLLNAAVFGTLSLMLLWAILSHRVRDGILVKLGLIGMTCGFGAVALQMLHAGPPDGVGLSRALGLVWSGAAVVALRYAWRVRQAGHHFRRVTDWMDTEALDDSLKGPVCS